MFVMGGENAHRVSYLRTELSSGQRRPVYEPGHSGARKAF